MLPGTGHSLTAEASALLLRPKEEELPLCRRYFMRLVPPSLRGNVNSSSLLTHLGMMLPVQMRIAPTLTMGGHLAVASGAYTDTISGITSISTTPDFIRMNGTLTNGTLFAAGHACAVYQVGNASLADYLDLDARL